MVRKLTTTAVGAVLLLALGACGDDSDNESSSAAPDATTATDGDAARAEYCAIETGIDALFNEAFSGSEAPTAESSAAVATQVLDEFADAALAAAPEEIADEVAVLVAATEEMANGNPAAFDTAEVLAAGNTVDEFCALAP